MKNKKIMLLCMISALILIVCSVMTLISSCINNSTPDIPEDITSIEKEITPTETDLYANVKFGETRNTLLVEIKEWYTYGTYMEKYVESERNNIAKYKKSDAYMNLSDEAKNQYDTQMGNHIKNLENYAILIQDKKYYRAVDSFTSKDGILFNIIFPNLLSEIPSDGPLDTSEYLTPEGYYIFNIYPYYPYVHYLDENGMAQDKYFSIWGDDEGVYTKREYERVLEEQIIPFCDEVLEKGLITQEYYDFKTSINDPLDYFIEVFYHGRMDENMIFMPAE